MQWRDFLYNGRIQIKELDNFLQSVNQNLLFVQPNHLNAEQQKLLQSVIFLINHVNKILEQEKQVDYMIQAVQIEKELNNFHRKLNNPDVLNIYYEDVVDDYNKDQNILQFAQKVDNEELQKLINFQNLIQETSEYLIELVPKYKLILVQFKEFILSLEIPLDDVLKQMNNFFSDFYDDCETLFRLYNKGRTDLEDNLVKASLAINQVMKLSLDQNDQQTFRKIILNTTNQLDKITEKVKLQKKQLQEKYKAKQFFKEQIQKEITYQYNSLNLVVQQLSNDYSVINMMERLAEFDKSIKEIKLKRLKLSQHYQEEQFYSKLIEYQEQLQDLTFDLLEIKSEIGVSKLSESKIIFPIQLLNFDNLIALEIENVDDLKEKIETFMIGFNEKDQFDAIKILNEANNMSTSLQTQLSNNTEQNSEEYQILARKVTEILDQLCPFLHVGNISKEMKRQTVDMYDKLNDLSNQLLIQQTQQRLGPILNEKYLIDLIGNSKIFVKNEDDPRGLCHHIKILEKLKNQLDLNRNKDKICVQFFDIVSQILEYMKPIEVNLLIMRQDLQTNQNNDSIDVEQVYRDLNDQCEAILINGGAKMIPYRTGLQVSFKIPSFLYIYFIYQNGLKQYIQVNKKYFFDLQGIRVNKKKLLVLKETFKEFFATDEKCCVGFLEIIRTAKKDFLQKQQITTEGVFYTYLEINFDQTRKYIDKSLQEIQVFSKQYNTLIEHWAKIDKNYQNLKESYHFTNKIAYQIFMLFGQVTEILYNQRFKNENLKKIKEYSQKLVQNIDLAKRTFIIKNLNELYVVIVNLTKIIVYQLNFYYKNVKSYLLLENRFKQNDFVVDINDPQNLEHFQRFVKFSGNYM